MSGTAADRIGAAAPAALAMTAVGLVAVALPAQAGR